VAPCELAHCAPAVDDVHCYTLPEGCQLRSSRAACRLARNCLWDGGVCRTREITGPQHARWIALGVLGAATLGLAIGLAVRWSQLRRRTLRDLPVPSGDQL
jgi:hypothetical protein